MKFILNIAAMALLGLLSYSCSEPHPNIILIVSEDNGPDLGSYGNADVHTPNLDMLAAEGVQFNNAYVTYSVCSPSRGTIFTGLYPHQNGQIGLATHKYQMYDGIKTLPKYLKEAGYLSGCIGKIHVNPESEIPWDYRPGGLLNGANFGKKKMMLYAEKAMEFIQKTDSPFFLMINYPDAHFPVQYDVEGLPSEKVHMEDVTSSLPFIGVDSDYLRGYTANYYNCINRLDESIGMLLNRFKKIDKAENTIIIYLGDHGAQFSRGKCSNYEAALKIPFIMHYPKGIKRGVQKEELISTIDLLPTILDIIGSESQTNLPGKTLMPLANGEHQVGRDYIFAGGAGSTPRMYYPRRSVRGKRFKLIHNLNYEEKNPHVQLYMDRVGHFIAGTSMEEIASLSEKIATVYQTWEKPPEFELYDLQNDPLEFKNLSSDAYYSNELIHLQKVLKQWQIDTNDPFNDSTKHVRFNQDIKSIMDKYELNGYRKDPNFNWEYVNYFNNKSK